jgi:hypothetical protein
LISINNTKPTPFSEELQELENGIKLIDEILIGLNAIQAQ